MRPQYYKEKEQLYRLLFFYVSRSSKGEGENKFVIELSYFLRSNRYVIFAVITPCAERAK